MVSLIHGAGKIGQLQVKKKKKLESFNIIHKNKLKMD